MDEDRPRLGEEVLEDCARGIEDDTRGVKAPRELVLAERAKLLKDPNQDGTVVVCGEKLSSSSFRSSFIFLTRVEGGGGGGGVD